MTSLIKTVHTMLTRPTSGTELVAVIVIESLELCGCIAFADTPEPPEIRTDTIDVGRIYREMVADILMGASPELQEILRSKAEQEKLKAPVIRQDGQLMNTQQRYERVSSLLSYAASLKDLDSLQAEIYENTLLFLIFAGQPRYSQLRAQHAKGLISADDLSYLQDCMRLESEIFDLKETDNPAIDLLRSKLNVPVPEGFVFVRYFKTVRDLTDNLYTLFPRDYVEGMTLRGRYILMIKREASTNSEWNAMKKLLPVTLSHELVHAYVSLALGPDKAVMLPEWFHEGFAVLVSGGGRKQIYRIVTPQGLPLDVIEAETGNYKTYRLIFEYAYDHLGDQKFWDMINRCLDSVSVQPLYVAVGVFDHDQLLRKVRVRSFWQWMTDGQTLLLVCAFGFFSYFIVIVIRSSKKYKLEELKDGEGPQEPV